MGSCIYLEDTTLIWTGTSMTSGNSIQVIHYFYASDLESLLCCRKVLLLIMSFLVEFLCLVHSNCVFNLPALISVYLNRENAALAVLECVDPLFSSFFWRQLCRWSSPPLLHHCQSCDHGCSLFTMQSVKHRCPVFLPETYRWKTDNNSVSGGFVCSY